MHRLSQISLKHTEKTRSLRDWNKVIAFFYSSQASSNCHPQPTSKTLFKLPHCTSANNTLLLMGFSSELQACVPVPSVRSQSTMGYFAYVTPLRSLALHTVGHIGYSCIAHAHFAWVHIPESYDRAGVNTCSVHECKYRMLTVLSLSSK